MESNNEIYKTPQASVLNEVYKNGKDDFYVVSIPKFLTLYLITMGFYGVYWFYKHWKQYKKSSGESLWPLPRALFSIFFTHSLFAHIHSAARDREGERFTWNDGIWATLVVTFHILRSGLDRLSFRGIWYPYADILAVLLLPVTCYFLYRAQKVANVACGDPLGVSNSNFTAANIAWIILGAGIWILAGVGYAAIFLGGPVF